MKLNLKSEEAKNVIYLFVLQAIDKILPLAVIPYLMITLGAEKYGYIGFSMAVVQYMILIVDFGFNLSATKRIAIAKEQGNNEISKIFFSTLSAKIILLIIATGIIMLILFIVSPIHQYFRTIMCMYPMVLGTTFTSSWFYQGIGKIRMLAIISSVSKILILPLTFVFIKNSSDYNLAAFIQASVYLLAGIVAMVVIARMRILSFVKISFSNIKAEIKDSCPLFLSAAATSMYTQLFTLILGVIADPVTVGRYSAADKIMRSLCFAVYSPINTAFYPKVSALSYNNRDEAKRIVKRLMYVISFLMLVLSALLFIFANPIANFLGNGYTGVSTLLRIISITPIAIALGAICGQMGLVAMGNMDTKRQFMKVYFRAAPISIVLVSVLSCFFADKGAALALLFTEYFVFISMYSLYRKSSIC